MTGNDTDPKSNADILKAAKYLCCLLTRKQKNKGLEEILDKERDYLEKISFAVTKVRENKGIRDAGSTADFRMLWSAMVCFGLLQSAFVCLVCLGLP